MSISALRSSKAKQRKAMMSFDRNLSLKERMVEFIETKGDEHLIPYLDEADLEKIAQVSHSWQSMTQSKNLFGCILGAIKDVQKDIFEKDMADRKKEEMLEAKRKKARELRIK